MSLSWPVRVGEDVVVVVVLVVVVVSPPPPVEVEAGVEAAWEGVMGLELLSDEDEDADVVAMLAAVVGVVGVVDDNVDFLK